MPNADEVIRSELAKYNLSFEINSDGDYEVKLPSGEKVKLNPINIRRNYERDKDNREIVRTVEQIANYKEKFKTPEWSEVKNRLRYSLGPTQEIDGLSQTLHEPITSELTKVYVFVPADESFITHISNGMLTHWNVQREDVIKHANDNMDQLVKETKLQISDIDGSKLVMLASRHVSFKSSFILSKEFKKLVEPQIGWPIYAVIPCRDFIYVIPKRDHHFLSRVGRVVVEEYNQSGHPVTKDVLEVSDDGISAIGTFTDPK